MKTETPIYTRLSEYHRKDRISFAMPGHKNLRGLVPDLQRCDVTELPATVDLRHEDEYVRRANRLLSEFYGSRRSFILTGGSTEGVQAMIASSLKPGDILAAFSDCHISVINTCAICGFGLKLIPTRLRNDFLVPCPPEDPEIPEGVTALLVTSPNYYGITADISRLAKKCRERGIRLLVDEAHGAHFTGECGLPVSAVRLGADMVCQSAHKTLCALTGAAYLHICGDGVDTGRVKRALMSFGSSSPSYPIAASADAARAVLAETRYDDIIDECEKFCKALTHMTKIRVLGNDDPTRIVLCFADYDISGCEVLALLSDRYGIDIEMADQINIVLIATPWNTHGDFMSLFRALLDITEPLGKRKTAAEIPPYECERGVIYPEEAWFSDSEQVPIDDAEGRTAAAVVAAYPPGCAVLVPGTVITRDDIEYIDRLRALGIEIAGLEDGKTEVVKWK